jgi:two-component system alkaline phosphatase synthesis response regulator PhoP
MTPAEAPTRAVVADDEEDILELVSITLRSAGLEVVCARDGEDAVRLVTEIQPALVVLDVMMPKLDGLAVTRELRSAGIDAPILLLSASVQERHRERGLEAGADAFVRKPFSPTELRDQALALVARGLRAAN